MIGPNREEKALKYMILMYGSQEAYDVMAGNASAQTASDANRISRRCTRSWSVEPGAGGDREVRRRTAWPRRRTPAGSSSDAFRLSPMGRTRDRAGLAGYTIVECDSFDRATQIAGAGQDESKSVGASGEFASTYDRSTRAWRPRGVNLTCDRLRSTRTGAPAGAAGARRAGAVMGISIRARMRYQEACSRLSQWPKDGVPRRQSLANHGRSRRLTDLLRSE